MTWLAPANDGGSPVTGYTISASPDAASVQVDPGTFQATLNGLPNAATDSFTVTATESSLTCEPIAGMNVGDDLAIPFARHICEHLALSDGQGTSAQS